MADNNEVKNGEKKEDDNLAIGEVSTSYVFEFYLLGYENLGSAVVNSKDLREIVRKEHGMLMVLEQAIGYQVREATTIKFDWNDKKIEATSKPGPCGPMTFIPTSGMLVTREEAEKNQGALNKRLLKQMDEAEVNAVFLASEPSVRSFTFSAEDGDRILTHEEMEELRAIAKEHVEPEPEELVDGPDKAEVQPKPEPIPVVPDPKRKPFDYENQSAFNATNSGDEVMYGSGLVIVEPEKSRIN